MKNRVLSIFLSAALASAGLAAQEKPAVQVPTEKSAPTAPSGDTALKVTVVVARVHGDKKISSLPYVLGVTSGTKSSLRMGVKVPVASGDLAHEYHDVGTNIDCSVIAMAGGVFKLTVLVADTSVHAESTQKPTGANAVTDGIPAFRAFNSSFTSLLRDGQTTQYTSATDPVSGEVMKIDVSLNVLK